MVWTTKSANVLAVWTAWVVVGSSCSTCHAIEFQTPGRPESVVAYPDGYLAGQLQDPAAIVQVNLQGDIEASFPFPLLSNIRGLAINSASDKLWAAHDGGVTEFALGITTSEENQMNETVTLTPTVTWNLSSVMAAPNGLCLAPDETSLYVTDPDAKSLVKIDLIDGATTSSIEWSIVATDETWSPNGCVVSEDNDVVWMVHRKGKGVTKYTVSTEELGISESFAQTIAEATGVNASMLGDGIVLWEDKLYISIWSPAPPFDGIVYECDTTSTCTEFAEATAADLQLDTQTPEQPQLILPNLVRQQVQTISLQGPFEAEVEDGPAPESDATMDPPEHEGEQSENNDNDEDTSSAAVSLSLITFFATAAATAAAAAAVIIVIL